jgi:hypothetical protein
LRTQEGVLKVFRPGPYEGSVYYLAVPKYSAFHTCNTWGAQVLRAAGFHVRTNGVVFAWQLWMQARRLKRGQHTDTSQDTDGRQDRDVGQHASAIGRAAQFRPGRQPL